MKKSTKQITSMSQVPKQSEIKSQKFLKQAIEKHQKCQYNQAIQLYKKSIALNPNKASTYFNLGLLYKTIKKYLQALKCLQEAIKIDQNYVQAYINLGNLYKIAKRYEEAQRSYKQAIEKDQNHVGALMNLGLLYKLIKNFQLSQLIFRKITKKFPNNASAYNNLAAILKIFKKYQEAQNFWKTAIKLQPKYVQAYYNLGCYLSAVNKLQQAEIYLKIAQQLKPNDPIILIVRAVNLSKFKKHNEAFEIIDKLNQIFTKQDFQSIAKRTNLTKGNLKWVQSSLSQLKILQRLNKQQMAMNKQQKKILQDINNQYMKSFVDAEYNQEETQQHFHIIKRLQNLENQIKQQKTQIKSVHYKLQKLQQQINQIKSQFQWDKEFDKLLEQQPKSAAYYRILYIIMSTSVQSYRAVQTGIVSGGQGIIKSKVGNFADKISKILRITDAIPIVSHFCTALIQIGKIYLQKEAEHIIRQIVSSTNNLFNEKKLSKATAQTILFLSKSQQFYKILTKQKSQRIWYDQLFKKAQKLQTKILEKTLSFGGHNDITDEMNMAMNHCGQILITMIRLQNSKYIQDAQNPLLLAAQIWLKQSQIINLKVLGAVLHQKVGFFSRSLNPYCKVIYNNTTFQTQVQKNFSKNPGWTQNHFKLTLLEKMPKQIALQVFDKSFFKKDSLIGTGTVKICEKQSKQSIDIFNQQKVRTGYLEIEFY